LESLTIHHGRHTFISHALAGGRSLAEVRDAAGHANVSITSGYLHVVVEDEGAVGNLFRVMSTSLASGREKGDSRLLDLDDLPELPLGVVLSFALDHHPVVVDVQHEVA
jgi:hypothetical protein